VVIFVAAVTQMRKTQFKPEIMLNNLVHSIPFMLQFLASVFLLLVTPGPGVLSLAGVGAAFGRNAGLSYMLGLLIGTNLVALAVVTGLAAIVLSVPWLRSVLLVASICYLLWLALRIAMSGSKIGFIEAQKKPGVRDGVILQTINPKAYVVNTALFTGYPFANQTLLVETLSKFLVINVIWIAIHLLWLAVGVTLQNMALKPATQRAINIAMAIAMLTVVILAAFSTLTTDTVAAST